MMDDPKPVQHFVIDINKKNLLIITFSDDTLLTDIHLSFLKSRINDWLMNSDEPVLVLGHQDNIKFELEKIERECSI